MANRSKINRQKVYEAIKQFIKEHRYSPSVRDLCELSGLNSNSSIHAHMESLRADGLIDYNDNEARTITVSCFEIVEV